MADETFPLRIQLKRRTTAQWASLNPVLLKGEPGIEVLSDGSEKIKYGDGVKTWNALSYAAGGGGGGTAWLQGAGVPANNLGKAGDFYLRTSNGDVYGPKTDVWGAVSANLASTVQIGTVTTGAAGSPAMVSNSGTAMDPVLDFSLPRGDPATLSNAAPQALGATAAPGTSTDGSRADHVHPRPTAGQVGADASGTAAAAVAAHEAAADPHPGYATAAALTTKADLINGLVPSSQLPGFVDDVIEGANLAAFPATGESGKIYVALDTGKTYRWGGSAYVEISASPGSTDAVPEGANNLYHTTQRAAAAAPVQSVAGKTGAVTLAKGDVGLGDVDNTSDANKPISNATQTALDGKVGTSDSRLSDSREWGADTISQDEAEAGTATTRRAFTALRVFQAIASWWNGSAAKTKLDGIQEGAQVNVATNLSYDAATRTLASSTGDDATLPLVGTSDAGLQPPTSFQSLTYAATANLDLAVLNRQYRTIVLTGNLELTNSNLAAGRMISLRLIAGASSRNFTFPIGWKFYTDKPTSIAANKEAVLSLTYYGTADTDCVAFYRQQP